MSGDKRPLNICRMCKVSYRAVYEYRVNGGRSMGYCSYACAIRAGRANIEIR